MLAFQLVQLKFAHSDLIAECLCLGMVVHIAATRKVAQPTEPAPKATGKGQQNPGHRPFPRSPLRRGLRQHRLKPTEKPL